MQVTDLCAQLSDSNSSQTLHSHSLSKALPGRLHPLPADRAPWPLWEDIFHQEHAYHQCQGHKQVRQVEKNQLCSTDTRLCRSEHKLTQDWQQGCCSGDTIHYCWLPDPSFACCKCVCSCRSQGSESAPKASSFKTSCIEQAHRSGAKRENSPTKKNGSCSKISFHTSTLNHDGLSFTWTDTAE